MTPSFVRRWIRRHPLAWVLGLALTLAGAQTAGVLHELSHAPSGARVTPAGLFADRPATGDAPAPLSSGPFHLGASGDCLTCLAVAALGGAAPAPVVAALDVATPAPSWVPVVGTHFRPRMLRAHAPRGPPLAHSA